MSNDTTVPTTIRISKTDLERLAMAKIITKKTQKEMMAEAIKKYLDELGIAQPDVLKNPAK
jgi:predicted DNA-binding protein